jgi:hypothetical protein
MEQCFASFLAELFFKYLALRGDREWTCVYNSARMPKTLPGIILRTSSSNGIVLDLILQ